jgi:lipid-binding SYLF domain-containing protein
MIKLNHLFIASGLAVLALIFVTVVMARGSDDLDANAASTLRTFYAQSATHRDLALKASGVLIFPSITKGSAGADAEYGQGVLQVGGKTVAYYSLSGAAIGATEGLAQRSEVVLFMTPEALERFMNANVWSVGADAAVAVLARGSGGEYDRETLQKPVLAFIFGERGQIADASLEGTKISRATPAGA